jgi:hypothetical protein
MGRRLYPQIGRGTRNGELDLRYWFDEIVYGGSGKVPHGHKILIRRLRRGDDGKPSIRCSCVDSKTNEPTPSCPYCDGEGWIWDEYWADTYSVIVGSDGGLANRFRYYQPGVIKTDYKTFFFRYDTVLQYGDKIIEVKLDSEGRVVTPFLRITIYKPETIIEYRADGGRIEYIAVQCKEEDAIRTKWN